MATATKTARNAKAATAAASQATFKTAEKTVDAMKKRAETAREAAFAMPSFEVPEALRSFTEQGLTQTRDAFEKIKASAEEAGEAMEESFEATRTGFLDIQTRSIDVAKANADATMELARGLAKVTSVAEAVELQTAYARERFEAMLDYSRTLQSTLARTATDASAPSKALLEKTITRAA